MRQGCDGVELDKGNGKNLYKKKSKLLSKYSESGTEEEVREVELYNKENWKMKRYGRKATK